MCSFKLKMDVANDQLKKKNNDVKIFKNLMNLYFLKYSCFVTTYEIILSKYFVR